MDIITGTSKPWSSAKVSSKLKRLLKQRPNSNELLRGGPESL